jgi:hypothetical protein
MISRVGHPPSRSLIDALLCRGGVPLPCPGLYLSLVLLCLCEQFIELALEGIEMGFEGSSRLFAFGNILKGLYSWSE